MMTGFGALTNWSGVARDGGVKEKVLMLPSGVGSGGIHNPAGGDEQDTAIVCPPDHAAVTSRWDAASEMEPMPARSSGHEGRTVDPLYVVTRGLEWHRDRNTDAGWELVQMLRSPDSEMRVLAAGLLAKAEHLRARDVRRAKRKLSRLHMDGAAHVMPHRPEKGTGMNTPYGLEMVESCMTCRLRKTQWFCGLSMESLRLLCDASHLITYPSGALLFVEGQTPRGTFVLCSGRVKLSTTSREGKVLILRIAEAGEALGLSAVISGQPFELTAETTGPCQVNFIEREALIERIEKNGELGLRSSQALSREFQSAYRDIHDLVLARSSAGKLAKLILSWTARREKPAEGGEIRIHPSLTHEEMAQMIGASRETVTRLIGDLKRGDFIRLEGSTLIIRNRVALEALAA
jgi:CRP/FNR family transcriptional regulator, cyclic AMP receptor protein